jgi:hypothetical protein
MPKPQSEVRADRAGVRGDRRPAALDARRPERSTLLRRPDHMVRSRLTWEEHSCRGELIEAPIVDPWVTMLNQAHLDVSRRQRRRRHLTWHATVGPHRAEASWCESQCCCARATSLGAE